MNDDDENRSVEMFGLLLLYCVGMIGTLILGALVFWG